MKDKLGLVTARSAAAQYLREQGYTREAELISAGEGDDFREVRIALGVWRIMNPAGMPAPPTKHFGRRIVGEEC